LDSKFERYAQRAGEEFVAAGRAPTPEQRKRHRKSAESYQRLVSELRARRRAAGEDATPLD